MTFNRRVFVLILAVIGFMPRLGNSQDVYWTLKDSHRVVQSRDAVVIQFDTSLGLPSLSDFVQRNSTLDTDAAPVYLDRGFYIFGLSQSCEFSEVAGLIRADPIVKRCFPRYDYASGRGSFDVTDVVNVKFHDGVPIATALELLESYGLSLLDSSVYRHNLWSAVLDDSIRSSPLPVANSLTSAPEVWWAAPSMHSKAIPLSTPSDEFWPHQFYLCNDGENGKVEDADIDADSAWVFTLAAPAIKVAVLDIGFEDHPDLPSSRQVDGRNFWNSNDDPSPPFLYNHGMACAGLLAATHNSIGIAGINGSCSLIPIRIFSGPPNAYQLIGDSVAAAMHYAYEKGASVISCSWMLLGATQL